jgi:tripartite-type tricarboxylate transporter receptor subunit TctC
MARVPKEINKQKAKEEREMRTKVWLKSMSLMCIGVLLVTVVTVFVISNAEAKSVFPSKTITFVLPVSPGGGFDTVSRMIIPYLQKYLPGKPKIIVRNLPGGEWNIGINRMYRSKPDGHTIAILNLPGNAVSQVIGTAKFDLNKITWLGNISQVIYVMAVSAKSKYKTLEDLKKAPEVTSGVVGLASTAGLGTIIAAERMGVKMKPIPHDGSTEAILAAMRGDVDWVQYPFSTLKKSIIDSHDLIPVWVYTKKRHELLPDVPTVTELGYGDLLDIITMFRPVGAPPGLPKDVARIWEDAFWKATNDVEFQQKMLKRNHQVRPMTPEETAAMVSAAVVEVAKYKELILKYRK